MFTTRVLRRVAWLVPLGILVQAVLAGQAWFVDPALFGLHGGVGHGVLLLAVVTAGLAWLWRDGRAAAVLATLVVVGLVAQTGLGYVGHRAAVAVASSLHVPLGVTLFGVSLAVALLVTLTAPAGRNGAPNQPVASRARAEAPARR